MTRNSRPSTVAWFAFLVGGLCLVGVARAQTSTVVWSCNTNCSATSNTYSDGQFRPAVPAPVYVAATNGTNTACTRNWWNTSGAVRWRKVTDLAANHCVAQRVNGVESFAPASAFGWPPSTTPTPVDCAVSPWSDWVAGEWGACTNGTRSRTETRTRTVTTQPANGGQACPALTETRTVSEACTPPAPYVYLEVTPLWVYTGENVTLRWETRNVTDCVPTGFTTTTPQGGTAVVGPNITPLVLEFSLTCQTGNPVSPTFGVTVHAEVRPKTPKVLPHLADFIRIPPAQYAKVQVARLETQGTPYYFKVVYFWRDERGVANKEVWATTWDAPVKYAIREQNGERYNESEARGECEQNCNARLPDGPLKDELDAWGRQWTMEMLGTVEP